MGLSGERDEEVYLYDTVQDKLVCVSCDPTGARLDLEWLDRNIAKVDG
jgi:hypothetical protein